ncbi:MAG: PBP1A family penicillin-binding protein, partial [Actinomycetota bacterium]|nr:PBP1A family penicillin-binding protein [Actinomycetota bacterium]
PWRGRPDDEPIVPSRRARKRHRGRARRKRRVGAIATVLLVTAGIALAVGGLGGAVAVRQNCDLASLRPVEIGANTFVYARDGSLLGSIPAERNREPVPRSKISPWMSRATVAIEDRRYYEHGGVDAVGIARALYEDVSAGKVVQGGSTIPQQLVRNLYPVSRERTIQRKLKEACLAVKLSRSWSKQRILTSYMNQVYYGNHAYGIEAAAQTYFSVPARRLTLAQSALIAGLTQAPSTYDPFQRPATALNRRDEVLRALLAMRKITPERYAKVVADRRLHLKAGRLYTRIREPYFFSYVREQLQKEYGAQTVRSGGLRVYTTVDPRMQKAAQAAIRETLPYSTDPAAAVVSIDPSTGAIRAMTAVTPGKKGNQFNLASQAQRQTGSTFKTFVLAAAIEQGMNPSSTYYTSAPFHCDALPWCIPPWDVTTYDHSYSGSISVESATLRSDNTVYAQLTLDVGPDKVAEMANRLGVTASLKPVASIGLGSLEISPLDMASAYATLAAGGIYSKPMAITKVVFPGGKLNEGAQWGNPQRNRVLSDGVAYEVTRILQANIQAGTGVGASIGRPAAGKTGTTSDHADGWFAGYTPNLQTTVWVGYTRGEVPMLNVHGVAVAGGNFPATIWRLFMAKATWRLPALSFALPRNYPVYGDFTRGHYGYSYTPPTYSSSTATTTTRAPSTSEAPPPPPPTEPPPPPTEPPPPPTEPPTTTSPPPPP